MNQNFDIVIVGGGILGTSIAYFLSFLNTSKKIGVIEQAHNVAFHTSGRNTGKVHAPYLYDPNKKKLFAKSAFQGYEMWKQYAELKNLPFKEDGVIEVALDQQGVKILEKYEKWGKDNGLDQKDLELLGKSDLKKIEPEIECEAALYVHRDASTDYSILTKSIMSDSTKNNIKFIFNKKSQR